MPSWKQLLARSITRADQLAARFPCDRDALAAVAAEYPMRINPYYLGLIQEVGDPIWRQAVPDSLELADRVCMEDPLDEENRSPVPNLVHKYPDRALFLVHSQCAMYCRFCTRKRKVGTSRMEITPATLQAGLDYLAQTPAVRDVLVSGGDPLLLPDETLDRLLASLRAIPSIETIRIGTRVPCTLPMRVTTRLARLLSRHHPLYINTHFNHPRELTPEATLACTRLANAGIPLGNQTVLLKGVNDNAATLAELFRGLLARRVKPYYLFQADMTRGANHFRTRVESGIELMRSLIGHVSGMAVPTFALDAPGGGGKIPLTPEYITAMGDTIDFNNYLGLPCQYDNPPM
ncbi:MAG: KamA family radical SAM protein [Thermodesulfobacteriota bacterium]